MLTFGLPSSNTSNIDKLLSLLAVPKDSLAMLTALKKENEKLANLKQECMAAKTLAAYTKEQEMLTKATLQARDEAISEIKAMRDEATKQHVKELAAIKRAVEALNNKEKELAQVQLQLKAIDAKQRQTQAELIQKEANVAVTYESARQIKAEYEAKIADLQNRLKGL